MLRLKHIYIICFVSCLHAFGPAAHSQNADINILKSINPQYPRAGFWKTTTDSYLLFPGTAAFGTLVYSLIKNDKALRYKSYELMIAIGINTVATDGLKAIFNRRRPADKYPNEVFVLTNSTGHSFPSGHTSLAFATATSLTLTHKKWQVAVPAYLWAGCMGYSRMYLGKHYPSDVLGGAVVGAGSALVSHWLNRKMFPQKQVENQNIQPGF